MLINDAYNANPASMRAAVDALARIGSRRDGRTVAVLGEMKELGDTAAAEHREVGAEVARAGIDVLLVVGDAAAPMVDGARSVTDWAGTAMPVADRDAALAWLRENIAAGDVVLVKASRGAALEHVAQGLVGGGGGMRAILLSGGLALIISLVGTRYAIKLLSAKGYGQEIREDGPTSHHTKRGTPTMGGIVVILASVAGYFFAKIVTQDLPTRLRDAAAVPVRRPRPGRASSTTSSRSTSSATSACGPRPR